MLPLLGNSMIGDFGIECGPDYLACVIVIKKKKKGMTICYKQTKPCALKCKLDLKPKWRPGVMAHAYNPSYSRGSDWEGCGSRPALATNW
jgi:hypothetical protein